MAGGFDACVARLQEYLAIDQAARLAAHPIGKQLEVAEAHKARMAKKLAGAEAAFVAQEAERAELAKRIEAQQAVVAEAKAAATKATAEVAALAIRYATERSGAQAAAGPGAAAAGSAARGTPPGYVTAHSAEEKRAERER